MEPLPAGSVGRSAEKAAVDLAKFDVKFWNDRIASLASSVAKTAMKIANLERFNGDVEAIESDIHELKTLVSQMSQALDKQKIELNSPSRVWLLREASR